jgi:hypothetical protein
VTAMMNNAIWTPQPRQVAFQSRPEYEALYGGAAGGGKSDALLAEALRQVNIKHYRAIIFRKTVPQLSELIDRSHEIYKAAYPRARYNDNKHVWIFPSGAKIYFGHMHRSQDRKNYQGKRYDFIGFDELTHFTWEEYSYMFSRNRPGGPGTRVYIRSTTNPGGVGHGWVKDRFITAAPPMTPIKGVYEITSPDGKIIEIKRSRIFVPASVFDNKILLRNDPMYLASLSMLPEAERMALLYGNWNSFQGQVFAEFVDDPAHYEDRLETHVINGFPIPKEWRIYRGFDFGYAKPFSVGWFAVDPARRMYHFRELYGCTEQPNTGVRWEPRKIAREIARIEAEDPNLKDRHIIGIADPAIWAEDNGESIAAMMERERVYFDRGDNKRLPGKMELHYRFAFDQYKRPMLYIFKTCRNFIRTVPNLVYSETNPEDVDTDGEDHIYDMTRYVAMENPIAPTEAKERAIKQYNPLDDTPTPSRRYDFYKIG